MTTYQGNIDLKSGKLLSAVKIVTKSWETIKKENVFFREEIAATYFKINPIRRELFTVPKFGKENTPEFIQKRLNKHSCTVINCMEALVEFINGNEETKPILFVLGRQHKLINVNEKMFIEMKEAICKVIKAHLDAESSNAWETVLQYIFVNYVFPGMHMLVIFQ